MVDGTLGAVPFGMIGLKPLIERGWIKQCEKGGAWVKKRRNEVNTRECGFSPLNRQGR